MQGYVAMSNMMLWLNFLDTCIKHLARMEVEEFLLLPKLQNTIRKCFLKIICMSKAIYYSSFIIGYFEGNLIF